MKPYYEHAGITIYHGDCRELLGIAEFDGVIADPPYGMRKADWDLEIPKPAAWLSLCHPKPTAVFCGVRGLFDYPKPDWIMSWTRIASTQRSGSLRGFNNWEPILLYGVKTLSNDVISTPNRSEIDGHPTPKPLRLMTALLSRLPIRAVCDPFMGSGTTLVSAKNLGLRAVGIEIEERYCEIAAKRLSQEVLAF